MPVAELLWDLLGNWSGTEEQEASVFGPAARTRAMMTLKQDLGGTAVVQDYRQVRDDGAELSAHGVLLSDPGTPGSLLWWLFDTTAQVPPVARGTWDAGRLALVRTTAWGSAHHVLALEGEQLAYAVDLEPVGQPRTPVLRGRYGRVSGH